jgi:hypothetical protein
MSLPFLLVGPQLRRVAPGEVCVWMLFSQPCTAHLRVYVGAQTDASSSGVFQASSGAVSFNGADTKTIQMGANMYLAVLQVKESSLAVGKIYSYNVVVTGPSSYDLKSLGLLATQAASGLVPAQPPLGYSDGTLPSFALAPALADLKIRHASCRKSGGDGVDALVAIDVEIAGNVSNAVARPHQLFLTGDQIYADDVALPLAPLLTALGTLLIAPAAGDEERFPLNLVGPKYYQIDQGNFPAGTRQKLVDRVFSSTAASSHLLSFAEFAAMYVLAWSPSLWLPSLWPWVNDPSKDQTIPPDADTFKKLYGGPHSSDYVLDSGDFNMATALGLSPNEDAAKEAEAENKAYAEL